MMAVQYYFKGSIPLLYTMEKLWDGQHQMRYERMTQHDTNITCYMQYAYDVVTEVLVAWKPKQYIYCLRLKNISIAMFAQMLEIPH